MTDRLEAIGYWFDDLAPNLYPRPQRLVGAWRGRTRAAVIRYLRAGVMFESYRAMSFCRFACGARARAMGHRDLFDGRYVWPEGLAHYVEAHAVRLPPAFVAHALAHAAGPRVIRPKQRDGVIDDAAWITWGRAEGAAIDLAGWQRPDAATVDRIVARLATLEPDHVLSNQRYVVVLVRPGAIVLALRSNQLAIIQLDRLKRVRSPATTVLEGWDDWPAATARSPRPSRAARRPA